MTQLHFAIIGAQKSGTTALSRFLDQHPAIAMSQPKETHVFDAQDFDPTTIDQRYQVFFQGATPGQLWGEATPIYLYFPEMIAALHQYNSKLKVIVLLRDPVDRAVSHYEMEKTRCHEKLPLWLALLAEPWRLLSDKCPRAEQSATRNHSYRSRGYYTSQLEHLYAIFPRDQVLVVPMTRLMNDHDRCLRSVFTFLGVDPDVTVPHQIVFSGTPAVGHQISRILLKCSYLLEYRRLGKYIDFSV